MNIGKILKKNTVINSALWYTVGSFVLKGVNFLTVPIFTNLLTPDEMGTVNIYSTWGAVIAILIGLGIEGTVGTAKINLKEEDYRGYLSSVLSLGTLSFLVILVLGFIFKGPLASVMQLDQSLVILMIVQNFFGFVITFALGIYTFERNHKSYLRVSFLSTILNIALSISIILSFTSHRDAARIYGWALATIIIGLYLYIRTMLNGKKFFVLDHWKFCLPIALPLIFHNLSHLLLNQADVVMIQHFRGKSEVGIYGVLYMMGAIINIIQIAVNGAWMPWYYAALKRDAKDEIKKKSFMYIAVFTLLSTLFILGVPDIIKIFAPSDYWSGIPLVYIVILGYYFVYLYTFPANYQFYSKQTKFIAVGTITAAIINILVNLVLIPKIGMYGAAVSTLVAYIVLFFMHFFIVKYKFKHQDYPFIYNIFAVGIVTIASVVSYIFLDNIIVRWIIIIVLLALTAKRALKEIKSMM